MKDWIPASSAVDAAAEENAELARLGSESQQAWAETRRHLENAFTALNLADAHAAAITGKDPAAGVAAEISQAASDYGPAATAPWDSPVWSTLEPSGGSACRVRVGEFAQPGHGGRTQGPALVGPAVQITGMIQHARPVVANIATRFLADADGGAGVVLCDDLNVFPAALDERLQDAGFAATVVGLGKVGDALAQWSRTDQPNLIVLVSGQMSAVTGAASTALASVAIAGGRICAVWSSAAGGGIQAAETLRLSGDRHAEWDPGPGPVKIRLDLPPPDGQIERIARRWAAAATAGTTNSAGVDALTPAKLLSATSEAGLDIPVGTGPDGPWAMTFGEITPHGIVRGASGTGKTTLFHSLVHSACARYDADELSVWLIDMKHGTGFATYTTDPLPQVDFIAASSDREFALSVLLHLVDQIKERSRRFKTAQVDNLRAFRLTGETMPRILAVIDEFQMLFGEDDNIADAGWKALDNIVRQGRSFGIHLLLGTQNDRGLKGATVSAREAVTGELGLKVALETHARTGQRLARVPAVSDQPLTVTHADPPELHGLRNTIRGHHTAAVRPVFVYDDNTPTSIGDAVSELPELAHGPTVRLGRAVGIQPFAEAHLTAEQGRNIGVFTPAGNDTTAARLIAAAAATAAAGYPPDGLDVLIVNLLRPDQLGHDIPDQVAGIAGRAVTKLATVDEALTAAAALGGPNLLAVFGPLDTAAFDRERLADRLTDGPQNRAWTVAWWTSPDAVKDNYDRHAVNHYSIKIASGYDKHTAETLTGQRVPIDESRAVLVDAHHPPPPTLLIPFDYPTVS